MLESRMRQKAAFFFIVILIVLILWAFLLIFRSAEQSGDSLAYAAAVRAGSGLSHPHHLIFNHVVRIFYSLLQGLHLSGDAILAGQVHNVFWGMVILGLLFLIVRTIMRSSLWAALAVCLLFSSWGFLTFATEVDVPIASLGALMISLSVVVIRSQEKFSFWNSIGLSLSWALAILYHQSNLIFFFPLFYWVVSLRDRKRWGHILTVLGLTGFVVLAVYIWFFVQSPYPQSIEGFIEFCFRFKTIHLPGWGTSHNITPLGVGKVFHSQLTNVIYLPRQFMIVLTPMMALIVGFLLVWHFWQIREKSEHRRNRIFLIVWLLAYYAFFLWWLPGEEEYFFSTLVPVLLLALLCADDFRQKARRPEIREKVIQSTAGAIALVVLTFNFVGSVLPRHFDKGKHHHEAEALNRYLKEKMLVCSSYEVQQSLKYYFRNEHVIEDSIPLIYYYQHLPLPVHFSIHPDPRILYPIETLSPAFEIYGFSGFKNPEEWRAFLSYLLDVQWGSSGAPVSCRSFFWVSARRPYLAIREDRIALRSWSELFDRLEKTWRDCCPKEADALRRWILTYGSEPPARSSGKADR